MSYLVPRLNPGDLDFKEIHEPLLAFDITKSVKEYLEKHPGVSLTPAHFLSFTQSAWRVNPKNATEAEYILSVVRTPQQRRQIVGVFIKGHGGEDVFFRNPNDDKNRYSILLEPVDESTWNKFVGMFLPDLKQGQANPVQYFIQE